MIIISASCNGHWKILSYRVGRSSGKFSIQQLGFLNVTTLLIKVIQRWILAVNLILLHHHVCLSRKKKICIKRNIQKEYTNYKYTSNKYTIIHVYKYTGIQVYKYITVQYTTKLSHRGRVPPASCSCSCCGWPAAGRCSPPAPLCRNILHHPHDNIHQYDNLEPPHPQVWFQKCVERLAESVT